MLAALGAWDRAFATHGASGAQMGTYTWGDGKTWVMSVRCRSPRHWTATKRRLRFWKLTQGGEDEGCLHLDRLPTLAEAIVVRKVLGLRKRAHLGPAELRTRIALPALHCPLSAANWRRHRITSVYPRARLSSAGALLTPPSSPPRTRFLLRSAPCSAVCCHLGA
jgi:hypothetical protein